MPKFHLHGSAFSTMHESLRTMLNFIGQELAHDQTKKEQRACYWFSDENVIREQGGEVRRFIDADSEL